MTNATKTEPASNDQRTSRFRVIALSCNRSGPEIQILDCERYRQMFRWRGYVAKQILNSGALDSLGIRCCGCCACDKSLVSHLVLVAAASRSMLTNLPSDHRQVANTMLRNKAEHLTADDVRSLLAIDCLDLEEKRIQACLSDLISWELIQMVQIDAENIFYDVDTRPHDHVFDPKTRRIFDA